MCTQPTLPHLFTCKRKWMLPIDLLPADLLPADFSYMWSMIEIQCGACPFPLRLHYISPLIGGSIRLAKKTKTRVNEETLTVHLCSFAHPSIDRSRRSRNRNVSVFGCVCLFMRVTAWFTIHDNAFSIHRESKSESRAGPWPCGHGWSPRCLLLLLPSMCKQTNKKSH